MKKATFHGWMAALLLMLPYSVEPTLAHAGTTSGTLLNDEIWSDTVTLSGDVVVPAGVTLTLAPGTRVVFPAGSDDTAGGNDPARAELIVYGSLIAKGAADNRIFLTSGALFFPDKGDWGGISVVHDSAGGTVMLSYAAIEYASLGVAVTAVIHNSAIAIDNSTIQHTSGDAINIRGENGSKILIALSDNVLRDNSGLGMSFYLFGSGTELTGEVLRNIIENNRGNGLKVATTSSARSDLTIAGNTVHDNTDGGIVLAADNSYDAPASSFRVRGNTVYANGTGILCSTYCSEMDVEIAANEVYRSSDGIYCYSCCGYPLRAVISGNTLRDNTNRGIFCAAVWGGRVDPVISGNRVYRNQREGISFENDWYGGYEVGVIAPVLKLNTVYENGGLGVSCDHAGYPAQVIFNDIRNNMGDGFYLKGGNGSIINCNNLVGNAGMYELINLSGVKVNARYNYWGEAVTREMGIGANPKNIARIYDTYDEGTRGAVDYSHWLTSAVVLPATPVSMIKMPVSGSVLKASVLQIRGIAAAPEGVLRVEVSSDQGVTWYEAVGAELWSFEWQAPGDGTYWLISRAVDRAGRIENAEGGISVTVDSTLPTISGILSDDQTWSGEVEITGDVIVPSGVTLTIEAGAVVRFRALTDDQQGGSDSLRSELIVNGSLLAEGTEVNPIVFTSSVLDPAPGQWGGIRVVQESAVGSVTLSHATIEYGEMGIVVAAKNTTSAVAIDHCTIQHTLGDGVFIGGESGSKVSLELTNNLIKDNHGKGIYGYMSGFGSELTGQVVENEIECNGGNGVNIYSDSQGRANLVISGNMVNDNRDYGIVVGSSDTYEIRSHYRIEGNKASASGVGIHCRAENSEMAVEIVGNEVYQGTDGVHCFIYGTLESHRLSALISENKAHNNSRHGIFCQSYSGVLSAEVSANEVYRNNGEGIRWENFVADWGSTGAVEPVITLNTVHENGGRGIFCRADNLMRVIYNDVRNNLGDGLYIEGALGSCVNYNNLMTNAGSYELQNGSSSVVNGQYNFWGDVTIQEMETGVNPKNVLRIYDSYDAGNRGAVDYAHWFTSAVVLPTTSVSWIISPVNGSRQKASVVHLQGIAVSPGGVLRVEVSPDNGVSWQEVLGGVVWSYQWQAPGDGTYNLISRVTDRAHQVETPGSGISVTVDSRLPTSSGALTDNETWSGEVTLTGDVMVPAGKTLTIQPGTVIHVRALNDDQEAGNNASRTELIINGSFSAVGTDANPITFTSTAQSPAPGDWGGIRVVQDASHGSVTLSHATIDYADHGISIAAKSCNSMVTISNSSIQHTSGAGISVRGEAGAKIALDLRGNLVRDHAGMGLFGYAAGPGTELSGSISGNEIEHNGANGLNITSDNGAKATITINGNTLHDNKNYGIVVSSSDTLDIKSHYRIENNEVYAGGVGIDCNADNSEMMVEIVGNDVHQGTDGISCRSWYAYRLNAVISRNKVHDNSQRGVYCDVRWGNLYPELTGNEIYRNGGEGVRCERYYNFGIPTGVMEPVVTLNAIYQNGGRGIFSQATTAMKVLFNNLYSNKDYDVYNGAASTIDGRFNYWGPGVSDEMAAVGSNQNISTIFDVFDESSRGMVKYLNWLNSPNDSPGDLISKITDPAPGDLLGEGPLTFQGISHAVAGVDRVQVSLDGGLSWNDATLDTRFFSTTLWSYTVSEIYRGTHTMLSRVIDRNGQVETPGALITFIIPGSEPTTFGTLAHNEVWSGVVHLEGDVIVPEGITLIFRPGTMLRVPAGLDATQGGNNPSKSEIIVRGSLIAQGTEDQPIVLTSVALHPAKGDWLGIRSSGVLRLRHVTVEYATNAIQYAAGSGTYEVFIENSTIRHNAGDGINLFINGNAKVFAVIENNTVTDNNGIGISGEARSNKAITTLTICGNTITNNGATGIFCFANGGGEGPTFVATICRNAIHGHSVHGIYCHTYNTRSQVTIDHNTIDHSGTGIFAHNRETYGFSVTSLTVSNNTLSMQYEGIRVFAEYSMSAPNIQNNTVHDHTSNGIYCGCGSYRGYRVAPYLSGNQVFSNAGNGVALNATVAVTVFNNGLYNNSSFDLYNDSSSVIDAKSNWWGKDTSNEMNVGSNPKNIGKIFDSFDNSYKGKVDYGGWLNLYDVPNPPILNLGSLFTAASTLTLSGTKDAGASVILNGSEVAPIDSQTTWSCEKFLSEGRNSLSLYSRNHDGMASEVLVTQIVRDTTAPRILTTLPAHGSYVRRVVEAIDVKLFEESSEIDGNATIQEASLQDPHGGQVSGQWALNTNNLVFIPDIPLAEDGPYVLTVHPTDKPIGNTQSEAIVFTIDMTAPAGLILNEVRSPTKETPQTISGTKEPGSAVWLDDSEIIPSDGLTEWSYSVVLNEGENSHRLYALDVAENRSEVTGFTIILDRVPPSLDGTEPTNGAFVKESPARIAFFFRDPATGLAADSTLSSAKIRNATGQVIAGRWDIQQSSTVVFSPALPFAEGVYRASVEVSDLAGNANSATLDFTFDITAPQVPTLNPVSTPTNYAVQTISGTKEGRSSIWLNGSEVVPANQETSWSHRLTLVEGTNHLEIYARDAAANQSLPVLATIEYDNTAPLPVATLRASGSGAGNTVFLDWTGYDEVVQGDVASYRLYVAEHLFSEVGAMSPMAILGAGIFVHRVEDLTNGVPYYFAVVAVDTRDNALNSVTPVSATPSDTRAPEDVANLQVQCSTDRLVVGWQHSPNARGDLAGYRVYVGNPGQVYVVDPNQDHFELTGVAPGSATLISVKAFDAAGNESPGVAIVAVSLLDNPAQVFASPYSGMVTLSWTPSLPAEYVKHYSVYVATNHFDRIEGMAPKLNVKGTSVTVAGLTNDVVHFFAVTAVNLSGCERKEVTAVSETPEPDRHGPVISDLRFAGAVMTSGMEVKASGMLTLKATDPAGVSRVEFHLDGNLYALDTNGSNQYSSYLNILPLTDGNHGLTITAYDTLGNPSTVNHTLNVALIPPLAPSIIAPASGVLVNTQMITVSGKAERSTEVLFYNNGLPTAGQTTVDGNGAFSLNLTLSEGDNRLQGAARNRAGMGPRSAEVLVTLDTTLPQKPTGLSAQPVAGGIISLNWRAPAEGSLKGFHLYRASRVFGLPSEAVKVNGSPLNGTSFQDLPPTDGTYYYRLSSVDQANNESPLSDAAGSVSDRLPPAATSIHYMPSGVYDPGTGRMAPGIVTVHLVVNEPLLFTPFLSITPHGGAPLVVDLDQTAEQEYSGLFVISDVTPSGTAYAVFSGRDRAGNRGTGIDVGGSLAIDTSGPAVTQIAMQPGPPVKNDQQKPVTVSFMTGLNEAVKPGTLPAIGYLLSGQGRIVTAIPALSRTSAQPGHAQTWLGSFELPADAGQTEVENLQFVYRGMDDLGNSNTGILCENRFQVYQGDLPPVEAPQGLSAKALPGGMIKVTWKEVVGAAGYQLYRKVPGGAEFSAYQRPGLVLEFIDQPAVEGIYHYAIASIRHENGQEAVSGKSAPVQVTSDATAPLAVQNLNLQLVGQGVVATWQAPPETEAITYALYRADANEITSVAGMTPIVKGVREVRTLDAKPSMTDHCYVVTAVDEAGNESPPSNSAYLNFTLLPVSSLKVVQNGDNPPLISWTHPGGDIAGYDLRLGSVKLNQGVLTVRSFIDAGWTGDERRYTVTAIDSNGVESPGRSITLPVIRVTLSEGEKLNRGIMNRLEYLVENLSAAKIEHLRLKALLKSHQHTSEEVAVEGVGSRVIPISIGGYADLPELSSLTTTIAITPQEGEEVQIIRSAEIEVEEGMLLLEILNESFTRGGQGKVQFTLKNTGDEEIEIVAATGSGSSPSNEVTFSLLDRDGNVLSYKPFHQNLGEQVIALANGKTVARIAAGGVFTSDFVEIPAPLGAPDHATVQLAVSKIYYHLGKPEQVVMDGVSTRRQIALVDTAYLGEVTTIAPEVSNGGEDITISGRAVERSTGQPLAAVPLKLVISVNSFERTYKVFTDTNGGFTYRFTPLALESGVYKVWAVHQDVQDKPVQGRFTINRLTIHPQTINLNVPKNYEQQVRIQVSAGDGTTVHNLHLAYEAADQPGGTFPKGIHLTPGVPVALLGSSASASFSVAVWADNTADQAERLVLKVRSDEKGTEAWGTIVINTQFSDAQPALYFTPSHLETGVAFDGAASETVTLENRGLADLSDVTLTLVSQDGSAAPAWVHLNADPSQGAIVVGEKRPVSLSFSPTSATAWEGLYSLHLRVAASNYRTTNIPVYVSVTQAGIGFAIFKVSDIYTGAIDKNGTIVQGLAGAKVTLQNEQVLTVSATLGTDSLGEALFGNLPVGRYQYRISANNHQEQTGRLWIKPGITTTEEIFLAYNLVTVEWSVVETTIQDKYEIVLKATFETNVPAAVVVMEPASMTLPAMKTGEVLNGEFTLTNHGLIRADHLQYVLPPADAHFKYELLSAVPESLDARARLSIPYRLVCLKAPNPAQDGGASGGGCERRVQYGRVTYDYQCANSNRSSAYFPYCYLYDNGECSGTSGNPGGGDGGGGSEVYGPPPDGGGGGGGGPAPAPAPIKGVKCWPTPIRKEKPGGCPLDTQQDLSQEVGSSVDLVLREFSDSATDLKVKVAGGEIAVSRLFYGNDWHFEATRNNLGFAWDSLGQFIQSIEKGGVVYERSGTSNAVYLSGTSRIAQEATRYLWEDKFGNWKTFALTGQMLAYGSRTGSLGTLLYAEDGSGALVGIADRNGRQVIWLERNGDGRIAAAYDGEGRRVEYGYTGVRLSSVKDVLGNITSYEYDGAGKLIRKTDGAGRGRSIRYDSYGNVSQVVDSAGHGFFFEFDYDAGKREHYAQVKTSSGKIKEVWCDRDGDVERVDVNGRSLKKIVKDGRNLMVTDERGRITRKELDEWQNVKRIIYPDGSSVSYDYEHTFNQRVKETDARGTVTLYAYDDTGNLVEKTEASGTSEERTARYAYDDDGNLLSVRRLGDARTAEALTVMAYDRFGNLVSTTDPEGGMTEFAYDLMGNIVTRTDAPGKLWSFEYDPAGRPVKTVDPLGNVTRSAYDASGNKVKEVDAEGKEKSFLYDEHNLLIRSIDPAGSITHFEYNTDWKLTRQIDPEGKTLQYLYDSEERLIKVMDGNGDEIRYEYADYSGCSSCSGRTDQPSKVVYPTFVKEYQYDSKGRRIEETDVLNETEVISLRYTYDATGNLASVIDKESKTSAYEYDALNRKVKTTDASGHGTQYLYDCRDNLIALQDPNGNSTHFEYDRNNRRVKEIRPMGEETVYAYDPTGGLLRKMDPKGQLTEYGYDDAGKLIEVRHFSATDHGVPVKTLTLAYDRLGRLRSYADGETSGEYIYDDANRKVSERLNYGPFELSQAASWYRNGRKKSFTGPDGVVYEYSYDGNNQPSGIAIPGKGFITFNAYTWNRPAFVSLPGGSTKRFAYDPLMRVKSIAAKDPGQNTLMSYDYTYDRMGNIVTRAAEHGGYHYGYDELYRLTSAAGPLPQSEAFSYDPVGNRIAAGNVVGPWSYNGNNELEGYEGATYTYDANGNTIQRAVGSQVATYSYDQENRLVRVEDGVGVRVAEYGYDPFGRRLWKDVGGTRTYFLYSDEGLVGEYDAVGTEVKTYGYRPGSTWTSDPLFMKQGSEYYFYHNDHLGTPMLITRDSGAIVWSANYTSFGEATVETGSTITNCLRLPGQYFDAETGLHYNFHRYYDPRTGRYFTVDPIGLAGGVNAYVYVQNDPANHYDSSGLRPGDIYLFTHTPNGYARMIGAISPRGPYGHAGIELPGNRFMTAYRGGVHIDPIGFALKDAVYDIYRPRNPVNEANLEKFAYWAKYYSEGYNWFGLLGGWQIRSVAEYEPQIVFNKYTCSEVTWSASFYSGNNLGFMGSWVSPNELSHSEALYQMMWGDIVGD